MRSNALRVVMLLGIIAALLSAPQVASGSKDAGYWANNWRSDKVLAAAKGCPKKQRPCATPTSPTPTPTTPTPTPTDPTTEPTPTEPTPTDPTTEPTPTDPPVTGWPGPDNTGVPAGVVLKEYTGPCIFRESHGSSVAIDGYDVRAKCSELLSYHPFSWTISNSRVPRIETTTAGSSVTISDSDVLAPGWEGGALWGSNITATRVEITGGQHSVHCEDNCTIVDSWLHSQFNPDGGAMHNNAFLSNGGKNYVVRGNTLHCTAILNSTDGGCTADLTLLGDWAPIDNALIEHNLFKANNSSAAYCTNAGANPGKPFPVATNVRYIDNVFERGPNGKCGVYGPVTSFDFSAAGNLWSGNVWDSGEVLVP